VDQLRLRPPYAIKVFTGGVNAVSGEPRQPTAATVERLKQKLDEGNSIQDYVVVPHQNWLDSVAVAAGQVRQFVAVSKGSRYSVEAQITGQDMVGGLQIEITPLQFVELNVVVKTLTGKTIPVRIKSYQTVSDLRENFQDREGFRLLTNASSMLRSGWTCRTATP
jgi:hypothetical protein